MTGSSLIAVLLHHRAAITWLIGFAGGVLMALGSWWEAWMSLWAIKKSVGLFLATMILVEGVAKAVRAYRDGREAEMDWRIYLQREIMDWGAWVGFIVIIFGGAVAMSNAATGTAWESGLTAIANGTGLGFGVLELYRIGVHWTGSERRTQSFLTDLWDLWQGYQKKSLDQALGGERQRNGNKSKRDRPKEPA